MRAEEQDVRFCDCAATLATAADDEYRLILVLLSK